MADVIIDGTIDTEISRGMRSLVFTTADIGYQFYIDGDGKFGYSKTTDGGASWGAKVEIEAATTTCAFDVWYDQWTAGDTGTKIHLCFFDPTADDIYYRSLDTNGDVLGTRVVVEAESTVVAANAFCSITKARGGNLYIAWICDAGVEVGFERSTDGGANWAARTLIVEAASGDWAMLFPGNDADANDIWAVYRDSSAGGAVTLKVYDDSANTVSESATIATAVVSAGDQLNQYPFSGAIRHSDGHLILAIFTERDTATADHRVFDINGTGSITELTAITTNIDDTFYPSVFIDQATDDIYVAYTGKRDGSENLGSSAKVYYTKSTDNGSSWSAGDTAYMEDAAAAVFQTWAPLMGPRFGVSWRVGGGGPGGVTLNFNKVNSVTFSAGYTLALNAGSFTITGTAASLEKGSKVAAAAGSVTVTGTAASLARGRTLAVDSATFTITGTAATFPRTHEIAAGSGTVTLTGTASSLEKGSEVAAGSGAFSLIGTAASLEKGSEVFGAAGSLVITGTAASLERGSEVAASAGSLVITGTAASLEKGSKLVASSGSITLSGSDASLNHGIPGAYSISVDAGALALTGTVAVLPHEGAQPEPEPAPVSGGVVGVARRSTRSLHRILRPYDELFVETGGPLVAHRGEPARQSASASEFAEVDELGAFSARSIYRGAITAQMDLDESIFGRASARRGMISMKIAQTFMELAA